jgi:hypothetical protein
MIVKVEGEVRLQPSASLVYGQPHGWAGDRLSRDAIGQVWKAEGTCEPLLVSAKLSSHPSLSYMLDNSPLLCFDLKRSQAHS